MRAAVFLVPLLFASPALLAQEAPAPDLSALPLGCQQLVPEPIDGVAYPAGLYRAPRWAAVSHPDFDYAWRWCPDTRLMVGLNNSSTPAYSFGVHVLYDGVAYGTTNPTGFNYLLLGVQRSSGQHPQVSLSNALRLALEGSDEHGCDTLGYDQLDVVARASKSGGIISFELDVTGTAYMLFPGVGALWVKDVGAPYYFGHAVGSWAAGYILWPPNLDDAVHTGTSLGALRFDAHTSMPGMHFQKHGGAYPLLEVDLDHVCDTSPLPVKPQFTFSMTMGPFPTTAVAAPTAEE